MLPPNVLTIAGSDCSGGAGVQADLKTFTVLGCYGTTVLTSLTAQNTEGVHGIYEVTPEFVSAQLDAVASDITLRAIKTGMLPTPDIVRAVASKLADLPNVPCVIDPVMVATSGDRLVSDDAVVAIKQHLLPLAELLTPNIAEAQILSGSTIGSQNDMHAVARILADKFGTNVLVKGGHFNDGAEVTDVLCTEQGIQEYTAPFIQTTSTHGTGCTLSAAITANLAKGHKLSVAVQRAKEYITGAIQHAYPLGKGNGPVNHAYQIGSAS